MKEKKLNTKELLLKSIPFNATITFTNNKRLIIKIEKTLLETKIKLDKVFENVNSEILNALIYYINNHSIKNPKIEEIKQKIRNYYLENKKIIKKRDKKNIEIRYNFHNIFQYFKDIISELKLKYDMDFEELAIRWGKNYKRYRKRGKKRISKRLGSFDRENLNIIIHPSLDKNEIPSFFIKSVIYHEIAHYIYYNQNPEKKGVYHGDAFKKILQKIDPHYQKSQNWEKENIKLILN